MIQGTYSGTYNTSVELNPMCTGCIYHTPSTAVNMNGTLPCTHCSRNYRDHYKSLTVDLTSLISEYKNKYQTTSI